MELNYSKYKAIIFTKKTKPVKSEYKLHSISLETGSLLPGTLVYTSATTFHGMTIMTSI